jgi:hypothetical protein
MQRRGHFIALVAYLMINSAVVLAIAGLPGCGESTKPTATKPAVEASTPPSQASAPAKGKTGTKAKRDPYLDLSPREKRALKKEGM